MTGLASATEFLGWLGAAGGALWLALLVLPWRPWGTGERIEADGADGDFGEVSVLIPARDEAATLPRTLRAVAEQGRGLEIVVVDDRSRDGTAEAARAGGARVIAGAPLPAGWSGKLWALEQGRRALGGRFILLLDADIALAPGMLAALSARQRETGAALVSVMAWLRMESAWERLLIPAFVFFFKLLYPFALANRATSRVAAGAGGCMLVERAALEAIGGFAAVRGALIDDCALARAIKRSGRGIWIGLGHGVTSHRAYRGLSPIWEMVARTAYTQLGTSPAWLVVCTAVMLLAFWAPLAGAVFGAGAPRAVALLGLVAMALSYQPVLRFYRRSPLWAAALPLIGTLYLAMTWDSARRFWRGERARWKGRSYRRANT